MPIRTSMLSSSCVTNYPTAHTSTLIDDAGDAGTEADRGMVGCLGAKRSLPQSVAAFGQLLRGGRVCQATMQLDDDVINLAPGAQRARMNSATARSSSNLVRLAKSVSGA